jgi:hypothetical protein
MKRVLFSKWPTYSIHFRHPTKFGKRVFFAVPWHWGFRTEIAEQMFRRLLGREQDF